MQPLQSVYIGAYEKGLQQDKKPFLLPDQAFVELQNAYVFRGRVQKRQGLKLLGRLRRKLVTASLGLSQASPWTINTIYSTLTAPNGPITGEPNAEIEPGTVLISIGAITFTDISPTLTTPNGTLVSNTAFNSGTINYFTGVVVLTHTAGVGIATTISFNYYPSLSVMGLPTREIDSINNEQLVAFDTKYAYIYSGTGFQEFSPGTTWAGTNSDFFWATNYRGSTPQSKLFFVTNFVNDAADPMRYYDGANWNTFAPAVGGTGPTGPDNTFLFQARILIPYYGRLLALNVWEGTAVNTAANIPNRCRYSQIGDPTQLTVLAGTPPPPAFSGGAWRSDVFGKGGFIDAPVQEDIIGAKFFKNTLIVRFERSTWQLRYVGEYGIPFIWERISSDFGGESTFSDVLFDAGVLSVGDRAITIASAANVTRIDEDIPDTVFNFRNAINGLKRVHGTRDFQRELVFWNYSDSNLEGSFPNKVLVYNYRNQTYAQFRDNVTCWGTFQPQVGISWDSTDVFWDDEFVTWDEPESQSQFPFVVSGNQQGYVHYYGYKTPEDQSLSITGVDLTVSPIRLTVHDHNLEGGDIIYIQGMAFVDGSGAPIATNLNNNFYQVIRIDANTIALAKWDFTGQAYGTNFSFTPVSSSTYVGMGNIALYPLLHLETKDFNPLQSKGIQFKMSYIDFLMDATESAAMSINLLVNSSQSVTGNIEVGNKSVETSLPVPYYVPASNYAWHRFYATLVAQYIRVIMTYNDDQMNTMATHQQTWALNAMNLWIRPGGKIVF